MSAAEHLAQRFAITLADALGSPHLLVGSVERMVDSLIGRRQRYGISYVVAQEEIEAFAPVIARLAGT